MSTPVARPLSLLILALGGEGGGVLADWVIETARAQGLAVQGTSVPGVAQRTGATSYYIEMMPTASADGAGPAPVFCLAPTAGDIDLIVSSELLETGRALERGLSAAGRTTLISSTVRVLTVAEKMSMADGRADDQRVLAAAQALSARAHFFDMAQATSAAGTVISSVMFGAICASGVLPLPREACERTIREGGLAVGASLEGFRRGHDAIAGEPAMAPAATGSGAREPDLATLRALGHARLLDYQGPAGAALYEQRLGRIVAAEEHVRQVAGPAPGQAQAVSAAVARFLALWMSYEDVIRVADLKTRDERFERIRADVAAAAHEPVVVREFLKPGIDEIADILPPAAAGALRRWAARRPQRALSRGLQLETSSLRGLLLLRLLAALRPLRPRSSRWRTEQALIERWLGALERSLLVPAGSSASQATEALALALEIAKAPHVIKGYGDTHARGRRSFLAMLEHLIEAPLRDGESAGARALALARAHAAALADPQGKALAGALGLPPPAPRAQPIQWVARKRPASRTAH